MKSITINILLTMLLLCSACVKEPITRYGFDTSFDEKSQGLTIMLAGKSTSVVELSGDVAVNKGEIVIELTDPTGKTVFFRQVVSPGILKINESFDAITGNWRLQYRSIQGEGSLILHLKNGF